MKREIIKFDLTNYNALDYVDPKSGRHIKDENLFVNENGDVISTKHRNHKQIKGTTLNGYKAIMIGDKQFVYLQRVVASMYKSAIDGKTNIRFIDGNKSNCAANNLEWY